MTISDILQVPTTLLNLDFLGSLVVVSLQHRSTDVHQVPEDLDGNVFRQMVCGAPPPDCVGLTASGHILSLLLVQQSHGSFREQGAVTL